MAARRWGNLSLEKEMRQYLDTLNILAKKRAEQGLDPNPREPEIVALASRTMRCILYGSTSMGKSVPVLHPVVSCSVS